MGVHGLNHVINIDSADIVRSANSVDGVTLCHSRPQDL